MVDIPVYESMAETLVTATAAGQEIFSFDFLVFSEDQTKVEYRPVTGTARELVLNTDYTVSGLNLPNGGSINLAGITVAVGDQLYIWRDTPIEREKDWQNEGDYKADLVNREQDEIYMIMQELRRGIINDGVDISELKNGLTQEMQDRIDGDQALSDRIDQLVAPAKWIIGSGAPDNSTGVVGDIYLDAISGDVYGPKSSTSWGGVAANIEGPKGDKGDKGDAGISSDYPSIASVQSSVIGSGTASINVAGYYSAGDGGAALYKRVATEPTHAGKVQSADGAWWEKVFNENIVSELGGKLDGSADVSSAINTALDQMKRVKLPVGKFRLNSRILVDNSNMSGETETGPQGISFSGEDARQTVLMPVSGIGFPALTLRYGLGTSAHAQHKFSDFAIVGAGDQTCMHVENAAMLRVSNLSLRGGTTALHLKSVLSSSFRDVRCDTNTYGVVVEKGDGFSYTNAIEFSNLNLGANTQVGFVANEAVHNLTFIGGSVEGNGTQGVSGAGGMLLSFDGGIEGAVGANIMGMYFENNGGGFDLRLVNSGSEYVTVNVIGCNFNRTDPNKFVTNNIFCAGRINLVLIGCGFKGYGSYVESASRLYVNHDGFARISGFGNKFTSVDAAQGFLSFGNTYRARGSVSTAGTALKLPFGWSVANVGAGLITVTHNLGLSDTANYTVVATATDTTPGRVQRVSKDPNSFTVVTENSAGTLTNMKFDFEVSVE